MNMYVHIIKILFTPEYIIGNFTKLGKSEFMKLVDYIREFY